MDRNEAADICRQHTKGSPVTLTDGRTGVVVDVDPERGCLWMFPDGGTHDERVWASKIERPNS